MKKSSHTEMVLSQYYLAEKMLFDGSSELFKTCWRHVTRAYLMKGTIPADQSELHIALENLGERLGRAETLLNAEVYA